MTTGLPETPTQLRTRWAAFWKRLGAGGDALALFDLLARGYEDPSRAYHTLAHVDACLRDLDEVRTHLNTIEVTVAEAALWFHDAIYIPGHPLNEQYSAEFAEWALFEVGNVAQGEFPPRIREAILATKRHADSPHFAARVVIDIDLGILGAPPKRYRAYTKGIRQEYRFLDDRTFAVGRLAFLTNMRRKEALYHTDHFQKKYGAQAQANMAAEIAALEVELLN
ncbi:hypothetical protein HY632_01205 [Candidatus Uhrbacteria bacterium]|nr:hypothetical protein [Candidatus Uhrbacteria bacterium]